MLVKFALFCTFFTVDALLLQSLNVSRPTGHNEVSDLHHLLNEEYYLRMELEKQISGLQTSAIASNTKLQQQIHDQAALIQQQQTQLHQQQIQLQQQQTQLQQQQTQLQQQAAQIQQHQLLVTQMKVDITSLKSKTGHNRQPVSFMAKFSKDITGLASNQIIVFDDITHNVGNAYNNKTGIFVASVNGTYSFSATIAVGKSNANFNFIHNGDIVAFLFNDITDPKYWAQSSKTIVLHLSVQDRVWIAEVSHSTGTIIGGPTSNFLGYLIQQDM